MAKADRTRAAARLEPRITGQVRSPNLPTLATLRRRIAADLRDAFAATGRDGTPDLDARLLVAHATGVDANQLILHEDRPVSAEVALLTDAFAARRIAGEPVARIVGHKEFYGRDFALSAATLVPRPDTETLIDAALAAVDDRWGRGASIRVADLGTGTGAILLTLLAELPGASGLGTDLSTDAIHTARLNARSLGVNGRASFAIGEWTAALAPPVHVLVANPPYIPSSVIDTLEREVRDHDPRIALDGGEDGLSAIGAIVSGLRRVVSADGVALIEIGVGQVGAVTARARLAGFAVDVRPDLSGIARVAIVSPQHHPFDSR